MGNALRILTRAMLNWGVRVINNAIAPIERRVAQIREFVEWLQEMPIPRQPVPLANYERFAHYMGSVRLSRYQNENNVIVFATLYDANADEFMRALIHQRMEQGSVPVCYMYTQDPENGLPQGVQVTPPFSVNMLDLLFTFGVHD